ncbi:Phage NinB DNA recombination [Snodgrassella communis]|uniref:recombination protein NinB n=1 Tax=Snodgrassella communis TaxID=2946699 RepID=UPI000461F7BB|nr:recombination protein NinB [Snodgrassella communis]KDN11464.1 Phage NinB DNA recombination [Snodgrassella communis]
MTERFKRRINQKNKRDVMTLVWDVSGKLLNAHDEIFIEVRSVIRSDEQNAKLHAMLGDIAKQKIFSGKKLTIEQWKMIFVSGHCIATGGQAEMAIGLEGEVINLRESTSQMGVKRMASLIEYITAWGAENDVKFTDGRRVCYQHVA